jgi:hypothetical protein
MKNHRIDFFRRPAASPYNWPVEKVCSIGICFHLASLCLRIRDAMSSRSKRPGRILVRMRKSPADGATTRHTLITELAESGVGDEAIMEIAGHVDR